MTRPSVVAVFLVTATLTLLLSQGVCKHHHNHQHSHNQPPDSQHQQHRLRHTSRRGCTKCPSGSGVVSQCRVNEDTKCRPCLEGASYSAHHSYRLGCLPCSRCGQGLYIAHPCTVRHDTICDACATVRGPRNCDFYDRCGIETWNETSRESDVVFGDVNITSCVGHDATTIGVEAKRGEYSEYGDGRDPRDVTTRESEFDVGKTSDVTTISINIEYKSTSLGGGVVPTQVPWTFSDGVLGPTTAADDDNDDPRYVTVPAHKLSVVTSSTTLSSNIGGSKPPSLLLSNRTKERQDAREAAASQSSTRKSDDDVDLDFLTSLMARETWDHSQERYEDSPQVALLLSRALKDHTEEERRLTECAQGNKNKNGCANSPLRSAKSEFAHRMEEWHKLDALNTFQVVVIIAVTCAVLLSALWVVLQCRKVRTATVTYDAVDSDEEYV